MTGPDTLSKVLKAFQQQFNEKPLVVRSPGRINLIGEHTDYNEGFVLPAAIDKAIYFAFSPRKDDRVELLSVDYGRTYATSLKDFPKQNGWQDYILGVVDQLQRLGYELGGFNCAFGGDIPQGAGLSSSAALENGIGIGLNTLFSLGISRIDLVRISQKAENEFVGVKCGIMDQFASMMGKKDQVIRLDCKTLDFEYEPLALDGLKILLLNTNVHHSLASSEYNTRRRQCEAGVAILQKFDPSIKTLRDADREQVEKYIKPVDAVIYNRCKYVVEESQRLLDGCRDLENGNIAAFGRKMFRTHEGLSKEYEVSCPELDYLVNAVKDRPEVLGARMMGGGFGGCTINLVHEDGIEKLVAELSPAYKAHTGLDLDYYVAVITDGTTVMD